jgi:hypothetical protein
VKLKRSFLGLLALLALGVGIPTVALAHRPATMAQRTAIRQAVVAQHQLSRAQARCQVVTISTADPAFARLTWPLHLSAPCRRVAANGVILEHHLRGRWRFVTVGSEFRCPVKGVPAAVARDLDVCD